MHALNLYDVRGKDLANVRLVCKALHSAATESSFERHFPLLMREDGNFIETPSMKLLRERPDLAVLVKSVWIAIAVQFPDYTTGSHFPESTENGLAEACREYYLRIGHEDTLVPEGPDGTRIPELTTVALKNRLRMLPKAHHIRMVPPPIT
jgi:hypothetical protein